MRSFSNSEDQLSIRERLSSVQSHDERQWGVMSVAEMVCHVRGAFLAAMGEIASSPIPTPMSPSALKAIPLWEATPWKPNFWTIPALKQGAPAIRIGNFEQDLAEALAEMDRFCDPEQMHVDHAFFGSMSYEDWMRWGYLHTDHHLRQFRR
jgi:Protein of unknown function (DUF1569)